jgi:putative ABC transport system permease protein
VRIQDEDGARGAITVEVLGFLDAAAYGFLLPGDALMMVVDDEVLDRLSGRSAWTRFDVAVADAEESAGVAEKLRTGVARNRGARVEDLRETDANQKGLLLQLSILLYGLVVVISLIGALNIVNTIGASLILRTREIGMLRAVGMSDSQLKGMIGLEGVLYGLASSVPGSIVGLLVGRLLFASVNSIQEIPWSVPWVQVIGACTVAILIGVLASLTPLRRIRRSTVVESLRGEE